MGVLPNIRKVCFPQSDSDDHGIVESTDSDEDARVAPPPAPARQRRRSGSAAVPVSPASIRRKFCGHKLTLKKGRRSQHRYENERMLFSSVDMDSEEPPEGWDIAQESRSHFTELLMASNRDLLEHFVSNMENPEMDWPSSKIHKIKKLGENKDPEEAYLGIHSNVRAAMKKHLPWGMLEGLDREICDFFESDPDAVFISQGLSSYERLLAHACSMYYQLRSQSLDVEGIRTLTIENPAQTFKPIDPSLPTYLRMRSSHTL